MVQRPPLRPPIAPHTAASAVAAGWAAFDRLPHPEQISHLPYVALAGVIGFAGNEIVAQYRIRVGRRIGSAALVADGLHARTDGFTSLAVVAADAEHQLTHAVPRLTTATVHTDPDCHPGADHHAGPSHQRRR